MTTRKKMVKTRKRRLEHDNDDISSMPSSTKIASSASSSIIKPETTPSSSKSASSFVSSTEKLYTSSGTDEARIVVEELLRLANVTCTETKSGWCLKEGLAHIVSVDDGKMMPLVKQHGPPLLYAATQKQKQTTCRHEDSTKGSIEDDETKKDYDQSDNQPKGCFQSLCRIVAGQQLAGAAAKTVWNRLQATTGYDLTPPVVLELANRGLEQHLQKPAGLSGAKARSIVALAQTFTVLEGEGSEEDATRGGDGESARGAGRLSDDFLTSADDGDVREALLAVKGIGPWSCDMFMMFYLERANILPIGDLGVRRGISKHFGIRGKAKGGALCPKADVDMIYKTLQAYHPYQSLTAYYMWRVADTKDVYQEETTTTIKKNKDGARSVSTKIGDEDPAVPATPEGVKRLKKSVRSQVTP